MLSARRKSDGQIVTAYMESKRNGPFRCLECNEEVILKMGRSRVNHFAHANPIACKFAEGESETHRRCKLEIYLALQKEAVVSNLALERPFGNVRPDVSAVIRGVPVAIEVQISSLSQDTIMRRTIEYAQSIRCTPRRLTLSQCRRAATAAWRMYSKRGPQKSGQMP